MIIVPLAEGENCFGWLAAFNHARGEEFGTVEASLLSSVGAILGIHCGNTELYRQQREFLAGVVRALTSAIDAKDPYTCGHSDRVARVAVRLAEELGCDRKQVDTIYLSGLLHDVGKIGIDDNVLRKPGKLTEAEYEHIKTHAEIGYKILQRPEAARRSAAGRAAPPRTVGRQGLSARPGRRADSAAGPHRGRGRRVRRHGQRPPLSQGHAGRKGRRDLERWRGQAMGRARGRCLFRASSAGQDRVRRARRAVG